MPVSAQNGLLQADAARGRALRLLLIPAAASLWAACAGRDEALRGEVDALKNQVVELQGANQRLDERLRRLDDRLLVLSVRLRDGAEAPPADGAQRPAQAVASRPPLESVHLVPSSRPPAPPQAAFQPPAPPPAAFQPPAPPPAAPRARAARGPAFVEPSGDELRGLMDDDAAPPPAPAPRAHAASASAPRPLAPAHAEGEDGWLADYEEALRRFHAGDFAAARELLTGFYGRHAKSTYGDNALYWIGETYLAEKRYDNALAEFQRVVDECPGANKVPDALFKMGETYLAQGRVSAAQVMFMRVAKDFPKTEVAPKAENKLAELHDAARGEPVN